MTEFRSIIISSGHGKYVRGAAGIIDEVEEARYVVDRLVKEFRSRGIDIKEFHDDVSYTQEENLNTIVNFHNNHIRDLDISVHFNAYEQVSKPMGVEVLYVTQSNLAGRVSMAIADAGDLINRGAKKRTDLFFLNNTEMPAILLEVCFVDSEADCLTYRDNFDAICCAIANEISGERGEVEIPPPDESESTIGKCSSFGGPDDTGVSPDEGLAFIYEVDDAPQLFLPFQPEGTTGLARRLNPYVHYFAMRFDYAVHPKETLLNKLALIRNVMTGVTMKAMPADWGPHGDTDRVVDLSPSLMEDLDLDTDDTVEVIFPYIEEYDYGC